MYTFRKLHESDDQRTVAVTDPVRGMTVNPDSAAGSCEPEGTTYYFCSRHCLEKFRSDPESFLNKPAGPMMAQPVGIQRAKLPVEQTNPVASSTPGGLRLSPSDPGSDKSYTCPMQPETSGCN